MHAQTLLVLLQKKSTAVAAELAVLLRHGKWLRRSPAGKLFRRARGAFTAHIGLFVTRSRIEDSFGLGPLSYSSPPLSVAAVPLPLLPCLALPCLAIATEPCVAATAVPLQPPSSEPAPPPTTAALLWRSSRTDNELKQILRVLETLARRSLYPPSALVAAAHGCSA
jgi:hypothetical protein